MVTEVTCTFLSRKPGNRSVVFVENIANAFRYESSKKNELAWRHPSNRYGHPQHDTLWFFALENVLVTWVTKNPRTNSSCKINVVIIIPEILFSVHNTEQMYLHSPGEKKWTENKNLHTFLVDSSTHFRLGQVIFRTPWICIKFLTTHGVYY